VAQPTRWTRDRQRRRRVWAGSLAGFKRVRGSPETNDRGRDLDASLRRTSCHERARRRRACLL